MADTYNIYLYIKDANNVEYKGNSRATGHEGKIEVLSFNTGFVQDLTGAVEKQKTSGLKPTSMPKEFRFEKYFDAASDDLLNACWTGVELSQCVFEVYRTLAAPEESGKANVAKNYFLCIKLKQAHISEYEIDGRDTDELPKEEVEIEYREILFEYRDINTKTGAPENTKKVGWDWKNNIESA